MKEGDTKLNTLVCKRCGKIFIKDSHNSSLCSECKIGVCLICGNQFKRGSQNYKQETCSHRCDGILRQQTGVAKETSERAKKTKEERYGTSNPRKNGHIYHKVCKWCGREFDTTEPRRQYCGDDWRPCPVCGKLVKINKDYSEEPKTCSEECAKKKYSSTLMNKYGVDNPMKFSEFKDKMMSTSVEKYGGVFLDSTVLKEKTKNTNLQKYGVENVSQNPEIREKVKETTQEHYGVDCVFQSSEIKDKIKETNLENLGVEYPMMSEEIQEKSKQTCQEKYGVEYYSQTDDFKKKSQSTFLKNYGVSNPQQNDSIKKKTEETNISKYGVKNVFQNEDVQVKIRQTNLEKYGVEYAASSPEVIEKILQTRTISYSETIEDPEKRTNYIQYKSDPKQFIQNHFDHKPSVYEVYKELGVRDITFVYDVISRNGLQDLVTHNVSKGETEIVGFLKSLDPNIHIVLHDRNVISPMEIDIYLPDYKFGIEFDSTVFHNSSVEFLGHITPPSYHRKKSDLADKEDVFLFHIFEFEWTHKKSILESMIENILGKTQQKLYARKCEVREVSSIDSMEFLENNHRQGSGSVVSSVRLGLYFEDSLVSLMTFIKRSKDVFELTRFCSLKNLNVVGGASKLFKHFVEVYHPHIVISYSDFARSKGTLYQTLGFKFDHISDPSYVWVDLATNMYYHRSDCQKNNLRNFFHDKTIDITRTEREIMVEHGFVQVFDCGVKKWIWEAPSL